MKRAFLLFAILCCSLSKLNAQTNMVFHNGNTTLYQAQVSTVDSLKFSNSQTSIYQTSGVLNFPVAGIDSITFSNSVDTAIYIIYNGNNVTIINPYATQGITIAANQGFVTATSTIATPNIRYHILGTSSNGSLTLSSAQPVQLLLGNLTLTNPTGAAFAITGNMMSTLYLSSGTVSTLSDGTTSTANAALLVTSGITINGTGTLNVKGLKKHAISNGGVFTINSGTLVVSEAVSDAIHTGSYVQNGGNITLKPTGDGVDAGGSATINGGTITVNATAADMKGIKAGENIIITGGTTDITLTGNQSKGLSATEDIRISAGIVNVSVAGTLVLEASGSGYDPSYSSAVKADGNIEITGGTVTLTLPATNKGGKGLSAAGNITIHGGTITATTAGTGTTYTNELGTIDSYAPCGIKADKNIYLLSGNVTVTSTGGGGKGISADSTLVMGVLGANDDALNIHVTTSGSHFLVSGTGQNADYANPKAIKSEGNLTVNSGTINVSCTQSEEGGEGLESKSKLYIKGGKITASTYDDCVNAATYIEVSGGTHFLTARNNDAMDSNGEMTISGGFIQANGARAPEEGFDCDNNTFKVLGGIMVGTGGATSNPTVAVSTQNSLKLTATAGNAICIKNASGQVILMQQLPTFSTTGGGGGGPGGGGGNSMVVLFSDPGFTNGTYTVQYGGTISGGTNVNGYNTGGTYSGGSTKTFSVTTKLTTVTL